MRLWLTRNGNSNIVVVRWGHIFGPKEAGTSQKRGGVLGVVKHSVKGVLSGHSNVKEEDSCSLPCCHLMQLINCHALL